MARDKDTGSWAAEMASRPEHLRLMSLLAFNDYWVRIRREVNAGHSNWLGDDLQSRSVVGSIPIPCSNVVGIVQR